MYRVIARKNGDVIVYGLAYGGKRIEDITTNRQGMELLAAECRMGNLDLCHLGDVVEDWVQKEAMI